MYGIFAYIYHKNKPFMWVNVSYMDDMGNKDRKRILPGLELFAGASLKGTSEEVQYWSHDGRKWLTMVIVSPLNRISLVVYMVSFNGLPP